MIAPYSQLTPVERTAARDADELLTAAAAAAMLEGRTDRDHDFAEYVSAVARERGLKLWPAYVRRLHHDVRACPSTA